MGHQFITGLTFALTHLQLPIFLCENVEKIGITIFLVQNNCSKLCLIIGLNSTWLDGLLDALQCLTLFFTAIFIHPLVIRITTITASGSIIQILQSHNKKHGTVHSYWVLHKTFSKSKKNPLL